MKMRGTFCERTLSSIKPAKRSYRWIQRGANWLLIGCPRGAWQPRRQRCRVGMKALKLLTPATGGRCKRGRRIQKG